SAAICACGITIWSACGAFLASGVQAMATPPIATLTRLLPPGATENVRTVLYSEYLPACASAACGMGPVFAAVHDWSFDVQRCVALSLNTMSSRYDPAALAGLPSDAAVKRPANVYVNVAGKPAKTPLCEPLAENDPSGRIVARGMTRKSAWG